MSNKYLENLDRLIEYHERKFTKNQYYSSNCNHTGYLKPENYSIEEGHTLEEYIDKYFYQLEANGLDIYKANELWLMSKRHKYWKIPNHTEYVYFEVSKVNAKVFIPIVAVIGLGLIAGIVSAVFLNRSKYYSLEFNGTKCTMEHEHKYLKNTELTLTIKADATYNLPTDVTLKIDDKVKTINTDYTFDTTGKLSFKITGNTVITCTCS